jgi:predicted site-specific integrase-resolvase
VSSPTAPLPSGPEVQGDAPDRFLSLGAAAAIAQVNPRTLARWADARQVTAVRPKEPGWRYYLESEARALAPGKMVTVGEASRLLGESVKVVQRMGDDGTLPCYRLPSGMRRFLLRDVLALGRGAEAQPGVTR